MKLRIIAVLLTLCLCLGLVPAAGAESGYRDGLDVDKIVDAFVAFCDGYEGTYTKVYANDSNALSVGVLQWHGDRAKALLRRILEKNPKKMAALVSPALYEEILSDVSWQRRSVTKAEAKELSAVLGTPEGIKLQNEQAKEDLPSYISHGWDLGLRSNAAVLYYCFIENAYGQGGAKYYVITPVRNTLGLSAGDTIDSLDVLHDAVLRSTGNYHSYRIATYDYIRLLGWNTAGPDENGSGKRPSAVFKDVAADAWYRQAVDFAVERQLFNGTSGSTFSPEDTMTRAMLVTVLYRMAGKPEVSGAIPYNDVGTSAYYTQAVLWASKNSIVNGIGDGLFGPDLPVTREEIAAILYRYAWNYKGWRIAPDNDDFYGFADGAQVGSFAKTPMLWSIQLGIISGNYSKGRYYLNPKGHATRAEVATILMRYMRISAYVRS